MERTNNIADRLAAVAPALRKLDSAREESDREIVTIPVQTGSGMMRLCIYQRPTWGGRVLIGIKALSSSGQPVARLHIPGPALPDVIEGLVTVAETLARESPLEVAHQRQRDGAVVPGEVTPTATGAR